MRTPCPARARSWLLWLGCCWPTLSPAAAAAPPPLTIADAIAEATAHSPAVRAAEEAVASARAAARAAGAWPALELEVAPLLSDERGVDLDATVTQIIVEPTRGPAAAAARTALLQALAERDAVRLELAGQVAAAYHRLAALLRLADATRGDVELAQRLVAAAAEARQLGERPGVDVLRAELELDLADQDLSALQAELSQARVVLNSVLGRELGGELVIDAAVSPAMPDLDPATLQTQALAQPDLRGRELEIERRRQAAAAVRAGRGPTLALQGFREDQEHGLRLALSLPLLDHGRLGAEAEAAEAAARVAAEELATGRREVALAVEQARLAVEAAASQRESFRGGVLAKATRLTELTLTGYRLGELSLLEVLDAQRRLAAARRQAVLLDQALVEALLALQRATGTAWLSLAADPPSPPPGPVAALGSYGPPSPAQRTLLPTPLTPGGQP